MTSRRPNIGLQRTSACGLAAEAGSLGSRAPIAILCISFILLAAGSICSAATHAARPSVPLTGTFSDLSYHDAIGDEIGMKVVIVRGQEGRLFAFCQMWEGGPEDPILVQVRRLGDTVEFDTPEDWGCLRHFRGHITAKALVGVFSGEPECDDVKKTLPRQRE